MINHREVLRRLVKYFIVFLTVSYAAVTIPVKKTIKSLEGFYIGFVAVTIFAVIDMVSPTICIKH
tara:strand:+ start:619 stop:813 length:195 start_codon:yes stop_codon:yes gene_type:complete